MSARNNTRLEKLEQELEPEKNGILIVAYDEVSGLYYDDVYDYDRARQNEPIHGKTYTEQELEVLSGDYSTVIVFRCPLSAQ